MQKHKIFKTAATALLVAVMATGIAGRSLGAAGSPAANAKPINVVWYPNESSNTHDGVRAEIGRLIEKAGPEG